MALINLTEISDHSCRRYAVEPDHAIRVHQVGLRTPGFEIWHPSLVLVGFPVHPPETSTTQGESRARGLGQETHNVVWVAIKHGKTWKEGEDL